MLATLFSFIIFNSISFSTGIINGDDVGSYGIYTYTVAIKYSDNHYGCNGGIISERFVISAASCFVNQRFEFVSGPIKVVACAYNLNRINDSRRIEIDVEKVYVPADYGERGHYYVHDIAAVKLKRRLELTKNKLQQLFLPYLNGETFVEKSAEISGFGWGKATVTIKRDGSVSKTGAEGDYLRYARTKILSNAVCEERGYKSLKSSQMCAKMVKNGFFLYGTCDGDIGSPLVHDSSLLIGVLVSNTMACNEAHFPALYTRASSHAEFIEDAFTGNTWNMTIKLYTDEADGDSVD